MEPSSSAPASCKTEEERQEGEREAKWHQQNARKLANGTGAHTKIFIYSN